MSGLGDMLERVEAISSTLVEVKGPVYAALAQMAANLAVQQQVVCDIFNSVENPSPPLQALHALQRAASESNSAVLGSLMVAASASPIDMTEFAKDVMALVRAAYVKTSS